jgi:hypothetical protein
MAAFFAINIEKFPFNDSGKLPLSYVLKYLCTSNSHSKFSSLIFLSQHLNCGLDSLHHSSFQPGKSFKYNQGY